MILRVCNRQKRHLLIFENKFGAVSIIDATYSSRFIFKYDKIIPIKLHNIIIIVPSHNVPVYHYLLSTASRVTGHEAVSTHLEYQILNPSAGGTCNIAQNKSGTFHTVVLNYTMFRIFWSTKNILDQGLHEC